LWDILYNEKRKSGVAEGDKDTEIKEHFDSCKRYREIEKFYHDLFGLDIVLDNDGNQYVNRLMTHFWL